MSPKMSPKESETPGGQKLNRDTSEDVLMDIYVGKKSEIKEESSAHTLSQVQPFNAYTNF